MGVAEEPNPWTPSPYISTQPRVKVLFYKAQDKWITLDSKSKQKNLELERVVWTIAFDGKNIGNLVTVDDMKLRHPDCGHCFTTEKIFRIENIDKFPKLGNKEERFSYLGGLPKNRPVVVVNAPNFEDKEKWKRFSPDQNILLRIFPKLKEYMGERYQLQWTSKL